MFNAGLLLVYRCCSADAWNGHGEMSCLTGSWCLAREGELGVTEWQAGSNFSDKGPAPQHLNEVTAGPVRTVSSRQESGDKIPRSNEEVKAK